SAQAIRAAFSGANVIQAATNLGFTGGNNLAFSHSVAQASDYVLMLNNDTTVEPDAVTALVDCAEHNPGFGLFSPVIHYYDRQDDPWFAGSSMDLARGIAVHDNSHV